jgi:PAS domain S-box-containing protein
MPVDPQRMLEVVETVLERFVADHAETARGEVLEAALRGGLELTNSAFGFIARIRSGPSGPVLSPECVVAIDPVRHAKVVAWLSETLQASARGDQIPRPLANLARAIEPLILDYEPRLPALDNFMAIPLTRGHRRWQPTAIVALANRPSGYSLELQTELAPLLGACGTVLKAFEDADERAARELELERTEQRFRKFMDASPCIAYITDAERRVVWASRAFGRQFQIDPKDAVGRHEDELLPGGMAARTREINEQVRVADGFVDTLEPILDANGVLHWWQGAKFPVDGGAGEQLIGSLALDVSDNVRITDVLRQREAALAEAQELARLGRWTWQTEPNKLTWDLQFERLCGRPSSAERGIEDLLDLLHPDDVEPTRRALDKLQRETDARVIMEHRLLVDGEVRELFVVARVRRELEEGPVVLAVAQDVSDRRRLERSRRELENKAHKFESLSVLAGGIANEFNNLLVGILGNAGIALDDLDPDSLAAACVQDIEASAERAVELTQQMLAFSGRGRFVCEDLELSSFITSLTDVLNAAISESVSVRLALYPDLPEVSADRNQLRQLIMNLVSNGSEAIGDETGELTIATGVDEFRSLELSSYVERPAGGPGRYVWLEVRDTGVGMDQATCARIFEPFFTTKLAGRGLGLAAVAGIVRSHGGGLRVTSLPGAGACFRVLLPLSEAARADRNEGWSRTLER